MATESDQSRRALVKQFLKTWSSHNSKRCDACGRRLKFQTGAWLGGTYERYSTCRSCGYENPSLLEKVGQDLIESGWSLTDFPMETQPLPQCMACGTHLLVSGDFTKVYCYTCGREWDRYEFEDIMGHPLDPRLAGRLPFQMDSSPDAAQLSARLDEFGIDYGTPYLVTSLLGTQDNKQVGIREAMRNAWNEGRGKSDAQGTSQADKVRTTQYVAVFEDYLGIYTFNGQEIDVCEFSFDDHLVNGDLQLVDPGFTMQFPDKKVLQRFNEVLASLRMAHSANAAPYRPVLFGEAARQAEIEFATSSTEHGSLASDLERLGQLRQQGLLSEEEFSAAKQKLLQE